MRSGHGVSRWIAGGVIAAGSAGAVLAATGASTPLRVPLVLLFLAAVPGLAVASLLSGFDPLARIVVAGTAAVVVDLLIAEAMILAGSWSPRTGLAALALVSLLIAAAGRLATGRTPARKAGTGSKAGSGASPG